MIDVKTAVRNAIQYLQAFQEFTPVRAVRLEETEYDESGYFLITLSTEEPDATAGPLGPLMPHAYKRNYKLFRIDAKTGEVKSMKVRSLQPIE